MYCKLYITTISLIWLSNQTTTVDCTYLLPNQTGNFISMGPDYEMNFRFVTVYNTGCVRSEQGSAVNVSNDSASTLSGATSESESQPANRHIENRNDKIANVFMFSLFFGYGIFGTI